MPNGTMINSGEWNGMESSVLKKEAPHIIEEMRHWKKLPQTTSCETGYFPVSVTGVSRFRSFIVRIADLCPVPEEELPLLLTGG